MPDNTETDAADNGPGNRRHDMKTRTNTWRRRATVSLAGLALGALLVGCGAMDRTPMASDEAVVEDVPASAMDGARLVFSPTALLQGAAKRVKSDASSLTRKAAKRFNPNWRDDLSVVFPKYGDKDILRVKKARFIVKRKSITGLEPNSGRKYKISMEVTTGTTLDDIEIAFTPSGLKFAPEATLKLLLKGTMSVGGARKLAGVDSEDEDDSDDGTPGDEGVIYHVSKNGQITQVPVTIREKKSGWLLTIRIPGFSEYNWDDVPEAFIPQS